VNPAEPRFAEVRDYVERNSRDVRFDTQCLTQGEQVIERNLMR